MNEKYFILLLAGSGTRLYSKIHMKKQFYPLSGKPMFCHPLKSAIESDLFSKIVLVIDKEDEEKVKNIVRKEYPDICFLYAYGGKDRNASVQNGLSALKGHSRMDATVYIHDSDRVLLSASYLLQMDEEFRGYDAMTPALSLHDSILRSEGNQISYLNRDGLYLVQTPQVFRLDKILSLYEHGYDQKDTDDFKKAVTAGMKTHIIPGKYENFKVTTIDELALIERIFRK